MSKLQIVVRVTAADNNAAAPFSTRTPIALALQRQFPYAEVATCANAVAMTYSYRGIEGVFKLPRRAVAFLKAIDLGIWNLNNPFTFTLTVQASN